MDNIKSLADYEFNGIILPDFDPKMQGRYKVHIPDLMQHIEVTDGIWCKNQVHKWHVTNSRFGEYGQHFPLHPDTHVIVKFRSNDPNTGYIDRIISDYIYGTDTNAQDCTETKPIETDRDEQYILFKTPKKWNIFYVNEEAQDEPNTIYLVYNRDGDQARRTVFRIDETGMHIYTRDNHRVRIKLDDDKQVDGNQKLYVKGDQQENIDGNEDKHIKGNEVNNTNGNTDEKIKGNLTIEVNGNTNISVDGQTNVWGGGNINVDAPTINLNCGIAQKKAASSAKPKKTVKHLENSTASEDIGKASAPTEKYNNSYRSTLPE